MEALIQDCGVSWEEDEKGGSAGFGLDQRVGLSSVCSGSDLRAGSGQPRKNHRDADSVSEKEINSNLRNKDED